MSLVVGGEKWGRVSQLGRQSTSVLRGVCTHDDVKARLPPPSNNNSPIDCADRDQATPLLLLSVCRWSGGGGGGGEWIDPWVRHGLCWGSLGSTIDRRIIPPSPPSSLNSSTFFERAEQRAAPPFFLCSNSNNMPSHTPATRWTGPHAPRSPASLLTVGAIAPDRPSHPTPFNQTPHTNPTTDGGPLASAPTPQQLPPPLRTTNHNHHSHNAQPAASPPPPPPPFLLLLLAAGGAGAAWGAAPRARVCCGCAAGDQRGQAAEGCVGGCVGGDRLRRWAGVVGVCGWVGWAGLLGWLTALTDASPSLHTLSRHTTHASVLSPLPAAAARQSTPSPSSRVRACVRVCWC